MPLWITCECGTVWSGDTAGCPVCGPPRLCRVCQTNPTGLCAHCDHVCVIPTSQCPTCRIIEIAWAQSGILLNRTPRPTEYDMRDYKRPVEFTSSDARVVNWDRCPECASRVYPAQRGGMWCERAECAWESLPTEEKAA